MARKLGQCQRSNFLCRKYSLNSFLNFLVFRMEIDIFIALSLHKRKLSTLSFEFKNRKYGSFAGCVVAHRITQKWLKSDHIPTPLATEYFAAMAERTRGSEC